MFLGAVLQSNGLVEIELPSWLLAVSYLLLGWTIGLRFTGNSCVCHPGFTENDSINSDVNCILWRLGLRSRRSFDIDPLTLFLPPARAGQTRSPLLRHPPMSMSGLLWRSRSLALCSSLSLARLCLDSLRIG